MADAIIALTANQAMQSQPADRVQGGVVLDALEAGGAGSGHAGGVGVSRNRRRGETDDGTRILAGSGVSARA